ncbi:hypothetical protein [Bacillus mycoides]|nr:hypothetical protein [Bacillus mycoides]
MKDELLEFVHQLKESNSQVVSKDYVIDKLLQIVVESYKKD